MTETGLDIIDAELARQFPDAAKTFANAREAAGRAARDIRETGRLHLLAIGGSHWVNRLAEPFYRQAGIDATAHVISEYMRASLPGPAVRLLSCPAFRAQGGFATAYQCTCVSSGKEKAVKVVSRASIRDSKSKQKVRRHAAARLERPAQRLSLIRPRCCSNCTPRSRSTRPSRRRTPTPTSSTS